MPLEVRENLKVFHEHLQRVHHSLPKQYGVIHVFSENNHLILVANAEKETNGFL
jgi:hypothetical protein